MDLRNDRSEPTGGSALPEQEGPAAAGFAARHPFRAPRKERFGGRKERYHVYPMTMLRVFDPLDQIYQVFGSESIYHAWLLRRFDRNIKNLVVRPKPVAYQRMGKRFSAQPDFSFQQFGESKPSIEFVSPEWEAERSHRYMHFAVTHQVHVELTSWSQSLELKQTHISNLEQARQLMTIVKDEDLSSITEAIRDFFLRRRSTSRGDLGASLSCERKLTCPDCFDAALFHLHCSGAIQIHWSLSQYDDDTTINRL